MAKPENAADRAANPETEHLVVAIPHLAVVQTELERLPNCAVVARIEDSDERLGLARLGLPHLASDAGRLREDADLLEDALQARRTSGLTGPVPDLDLVMFALRRQFATRYHGWTPTIGKNRYLEGIHGFPEIVGGGKGYPEPTSGRRIRFPRSNPAGAPVRVAILDTGLYPHPRLVGTYIADDRSLHFGRQPRPQSAGHATFIAGLVLQQASDVVLTVVRVLNDDATATSWEVARTMARLAGSGVDIINVSWGCRTADGQPPLVLTRAVELLSPTTVIVAAAGNHPTHRDGSPAVPPTMPTFPAAFTNVVAVGATNPDGSPADFNPRGPWLDLRAPGVEVSSTYLRGDVWVGRDPRRPDRVTLTPFPGYACWSGSSFAAANVTGEIAAHTRPGRRSAHEVLAEMLNAKPGQDVYRARPCSAE